MTPLLIRNLTLAGNRCGRRCYSVKRLNDPVDLGLGDENRIRRTMLHEVDLDAAVIGIETDLQTVLVRLRIALLESLKLWGLNAKNTRLRSLRRHD
jgi:hypothetical protein